MDLKAGPAVCDGKAKCSFFWLHFGWHKPLPQQKQFSLPALSGEEELLVRGSQPPAASLAGYFWLFWCFLKLLWCLPAAPRHSRAQTRVDSLSQRHQLGLGLPQEVRSVKGWPLQALGYSPAEQWGQSPRGVCSARGTDTALNPAEGNLHQQTQPQLCKESWALLGTTSGTC